MSDITKKKIVIDLDDTISITENGKYLESIPNLQVVEKLREYKELGYDIVIHSSRNMRTYNNNIGEINVTAIVIVNALGDIFDPFDGNKKIAGLLTNNRTEFADTCSALYNFIAPRDMFTGNTTIGAIITNADFNKGELNKIASMTRNAYARCINPVGTMADGDSIYAASTGNIKADINVIGTLSAEVMSAAIVNAIKESSIPDEEFLSNIK